MGEKGGDEMAPVLFVYVPKVEVLETTHRGLTSIAHDFHVLDDCETGKRQTTSVTEARRARVSSGGK
jgi:hypothetical protein